MNTPAAGTSRTAETSPGSRQWTVGLVIASLASSVGAARSLCHRFARCADHRRTSAGTPRARSRRRAAAWRAPPRPGRRAARWRGRPATSRSAACPATPSRASVIRTTAHRVWSSALADTESTLRVTSRPARARSTAPTASVAAQRYSQDDVGGRSEVRCGAQLAQQRRQLVRAERAQADPGGPPVRWPAPRRPRARCAPPSRRRRGPRSSPGPRPVRGGPRAGRGSTAGTRAPAGTGKSGRAEPRVDARPARPHCSTSTCTAAGRAGSPKARSRTSASGHGGEPASSTTTSPWPSPATPKARRRGWVRRLPVQSGEVRRRRSDHGAGRRPRRPAAAAAADDPGDPGHRGDSCDRVPDGCPKAIPVTATASTASTNTTVERPVSSDCPRPANHRPSGRVVSEHLPGSLLQVPGCRPEPGGGAPVATTKEQAEAYGYEGAGRRRPS